MWNHLEKCRHGKSLTLSLQSHVRKQTSWLEHRDYLDRLSEVITSPFLLKDRLIKSGDVSIYHEHNIISHVREQKYMEKQYCSKLEHLVYFSSGDVVVLGESYI